MLSVCLVAAALAASTLAVPSPTETAKRATCTVDSPQAAADLSGCSNVEITSFTVPNDSKLTLTYDFVESVLTYTQATITMSVRILQQTSGYDLTEMLHRTSLQKVQR